jgi:ornithine carbamoyltransferase
VAEPRHFLDLDRISAADLRRMLDIGLGYKHPAKTGPGRGAPPPRHPLTGKTLAMIFEKHSTRTRVSFEVAMKQLGGDAVMLTHSDSQMGRGEPIKDTARVLSRYVDAIMIRTTEQSKLEELARYSSVPVINGLTDQSHPCQIMADVMTLEEYKGDLAAQIVAWTGDGNNVATSWIHAAARFGFELRLACPEEYQPAPSILAWAAGEGARVFVTTDPVEAVSGASCVVTDTWVSMGDDVDTMNDPNPGRGKTSRERRHNLLAPYRVDERLMGLARPEAVFMHCLPAHRGEEVTAGVIDGPQSIVWDEAENRLHVQKGILAWCMAPHDHSPSLPLWER